MDRVTVLLLCTLIVVGVMGLQGLRATLQSDYTIFSGATLKTVGVNVYVDSNLTFPCTAIDWGFVASNQTVTRQVYVVSDSSVPVTLTVATSDWTPPTVQPYLTFTATPVNVTVQPDTVLPVTFTLATAVNASDSGIREFSFHIHLIGVE